MTADPLGRITYVLLESEGKTELRALANCQVHELTDQMQEIVG